MCEYTGLERGNIYQWLYNIIVDNGLNLKRFFSNNGHYLMTLLDFG